MLTYQPSPILREAIDAGLVFIDTSKEYKVKTLDKELNYLLSKGRTKEELFEKMQETGGAFYQISTAAEFIRNKEMIEAEKKRLLPEQERMQKEIEWASGNFSHIPDNEKIQTTCFIDDKGRCWDEIWDGKNPKTLGFISINEDGNIIKIKGSKPYVPYNGDFLIKGCVKLASDAEEYGSTEDLLRDIQAHVHKYVDVTPEFEKYTAYYILLTWLQDKVPEVPYLRVMGDFGTGKSRYLDVVGDICYKYVNTSAAASNAAMFRTIELMGIPTVGIDEGDLKMSDTAAELIKTLNLGFQQGKTISRCEKEDGNYSIHPFGVFGCKIISTRFPFDDKALESRCITEIMTSTTRKDIPYNGSSEAYKKAVVSLRNKLMMYRLQNYAFVTPLDSHPLLDEAEIEGRLKQTAIGFFTVITDDNVRKNFVDFFKQYNKRLVEERSSSLEGRIVNALLTMTAEGRTNIICSELVNHLNNEMVLREKDKVNETQIGKLLRALNFESKPKKISGETRRVICWTDEQMEKLKRRYVIPEDFELVKETIKEREERMTSSGGVDVINFDRS